MRVTISGESDRRLWAFIRALKTEVGGMGYANLENNELHWSRTFLVPQEVSAAEVDFEATNGDLVAIEQALEDGVLDDPNFVWVSWHSHHTMDAYWSSTDDKRIAAMHKVGVKRLLSFVGCHDGNYKLRLDVFDVQAHDVDIGQVTINGLTLDREKVEVDDFTKSIHAELKDNVKKQSYSYTKPTKLSKPTGMLVPTLADRELAFHGITDEVNNDELVEKLVWYGYKQKEATEMVEESPTECEDIIERFEQL